MAPFDSFIDRLCTRSSELSSRFRRQDRTGRNPDGLTSNRQPGVQNKNEDTQWRPFELPPRGHTITPNSSTTTLHLSLQPQGQSPLFCKLPPEIRSQIWKEVVGDQTIHILRQGHGLSHVICYAQGLEDWWRHGCFVQSWGDDNCPYAGRTKDGRRQDGGKLGLLMSCRRVYFEAIALMYSTNTFDIHDWERLVDFTCSILPHRLAIIGGLNFRYFHSTVHNQNLSLQKWLQITDVLKRMEGLEKLKLEISTEKHAIGLGQAEARFDEEKLLGPLREIDHVKDFIVDVNWLSPEGSLQDDGEWPFRLRRLIHR